jgi:hypothetical protein
VQCPLIERSSAAVKQSRPLVSSVRKGGEVARP